MSLCVRCGAELEPGARACKRCGAEVASAAPRTVTRAAAVQAAAQASAAQAPQGDDPVLAQLQRTLAAVYKVERLLGRGELAAVYRASELNPQRPVALKVLPQGLGLGAAAPRFKREARVAAALNHPHIVPIYRVGLTGGAYFFAMKLVEGRSLDAIVGSQGPLAVPVVLEVLRGAASALAYAHERGAVHGDIKGANILVERDGRVMVTDFGIARAVEDETRTAAGATAANRHLMNPEQALGRTLVAQSDQYSLGIVAVQMITGTLPPSAATLTAIADGRAMRPGLPEGLMQVVRTCLAQDPARRYATTAEMLAAIEAVPVGDAERQQALDVLGQLARGEPVPKLQAATRTPTAEPRRAPIPPTRQEAAIPDQPAPPRQAATPTGPPRVAVRPPSPPPPPPPEEEPAAEELPAEEPTAEVGRPSSVAPLRDAVRRSGTGAAASDARRDSGAATTRDDLRRALAAAAPEAVRVITPEPAKGRGRMIWVVAATVVVMLALAGAAYWFLVLGHRPGAGSAAQTPLTTQAPSPALAAVPAARPAADSARADTAHRAGAPADSAKRDTSSAGENTGLLLFNAVPPFADIRVDGLAAGTDGFVDSEVTPGRRRIRVSAPGYVTRDTVVMVRAGETVNLGQIALREAAGAAARATGRITFTTVPPTAEVFVDGLSVGVGGLNGYQVAAGDREVRISAPGFLMMDTTVTVTAGATLDLGAVVLRSTPGGP